MRNEAERRLFEFFQENALVIANTLFQKHKKEIVAKDIFMKDYYTKYIRTTIIKQKT